MTSAKATAPAHLAIVGAGRVGQALAGACRAAGIQHTLLSRDRPAGVLADADAVLICVADEQIESVAGEIAGEVGHGAIVGHTSGATPITALDPVAGRCAGTFGLHPLQTIPSGETPLGSVPCAVSASSPRVLEQARALARALGLEPFSIAEADRAAYHAAATIASNFLFALEESAAELLEGAGVESAREVLAPLVRASAANWARHGAGALTGPIARGDEQTVDRHLAAIAERVPELSPLYEALAERTRAIAASPEPVG